MSSAASGSVGASSMALAHSLQRVDQCLEEREGGVIFSTCRIPKDLVKMILQYTSLYVRATMSFHLMTFPNFSRAFGSVQRLLDAPNSAKSLDVDRFREESLLRARNKDGGFPMMTSQEVERAQEQNTWLYPVSKDNKPIWSVDGLQLSIYCRTVYPLSKGPEAKSAFAERVVIVLSGGQYSLCICSTADSDSKCMTEYSTEERLETLQIQQRPAFDWCPIS